MKKSFITNFLISKHAVLFGMLCCFIFSEILTSNEIEGKYIPDIQSANSSNEFIVGYSPSVFRNINLSDAKAASKILLQTILKHANSNLKSENVIIHDLIKNTDIINKKELNVITMTGIEYLAVRNKVRLYPLAVPAVGDSCLEKLVLLTRKDSGIKSVSDLKNKTIIVESVVVEDNLNILNIWLNVLFKRNKIEFKKNRLTADIKGGSPSRIITNVFFKKYDAAVVLESELKIVSELNPQVGKELIVLSESKPMLLAISFYTEKQKKAEDHELLTSAIFKMHETAAGKNFTKLFRMKKFVPFMNEYLDNISELYDEYLASQKMKNRLR
ncbi:MAG: hypothetical protein CVV24_03765 [Ignavibacteriae bacterium HGW-Ignavibacteriae-3]|nr:MAG: hypothetical protein CVV24_03765 [Ignavibacteriae bacterium HGW-Ignavibacteriae-3]